MGNTFRSSFFILLVQLGAVFWGLTFIRRGYFFLVHDKWIPIYSSTLIGGTIGLTLISAVVWWWYKVKITNDAIRGPNIWGSIITIPFGLGFQFSEINILMFKYLKIWSAEKGSIWIPLPVGNQSDFYSLLKTKSEQNT